MRAQTRVGRPIRTFRFRRSGDLRGSDRPRLVRVSPDCQLDRETVRRGDGESGKAGDLGQRPLFAIGEGEKNCGDLLVTD
jgi:hypothetical protein